MAIKQWTVLKAEEEEMIEVEEVDLREEGMIQETEAVITQEGEEDLEEIQEIGQEEVDVIVDHPEIEEIDVEEDHHSLMILIADQDLARLVHSEVDTLVIREETLLKEVDLIPTIAEADDHTLQSQTDLQDLIDHQDHKSDQEPQDQ